MKLKDRIVFKYNGTPLNYTVEKHIGYYLYCSGEPNDKIFHLLSIPDKFSFCENIIGHSIENSIKESLTFPEVNNLEDLEKIVDALYQRIIDLSTPKFKVGDKVKILPKSKGIQDYPCSYVPQMEKFSDTTTIIKHVQKISVTRLKNYISLAKYEEPFYYLLKDIGFNWTSAMLESVSKIEDKKEDVSPRKFNIGNKVKVKTLNKEDSYGVYLNTNMLQYCGKEFVIVDFQEMLGGSNVKCDGYRYSLNGITNWVWTSDMLAKSEDDTEDALGITLGEPHDLSVMQKEYVELYDTIKDGSIFSPLESTKADTNTQIDTFKNIKTTTAPISFEEEKDSNVDYKLNFTVASLDFKK